LELIKAVDSRMGTKFISDELLFFGLCLHLKSFVYRFRNNVYYKKTSQFQLTDSNLNIYNAVIQAGGLYNEICGVKPDEEELLNLTCYLLLSLRRNIRRPKAMLVCNEGILERMELMDTLANSLPSVDIADCCTTYQLKLLSLNEFDFLISTEVVEDLDKPIAGLSSLDRSEYADYIVSFINNKPT